MKKLILLFFLVCPPVLAQSIPDINNFCAYTKDSARAQADQDRMPNLTSGLTQEPLDQPAETFIGIKESLANIRKGNAEIREGDAVCKDYRDSQLANEKITYSIPFLEKVALSQRISIDLEGENEMELLISNLDEKVKEHDSTVSILYTLQSSKSKIEQDLENTKQQLSTYQIPVLTDLSLQSLISSKEIDDIGEQKEENKIISSQNWNLDLEVGAYHQAIPFLQSGMAPYGSFTFTYNFGRRQVDKHLDKSVSEYGDYKKVEVGDVISNYNLLHRELVDNKAALEEKYNVLLNQKKTIDSYLSSVKDEQTDEEITFATQLKSDRILLNIEIQDTNYRLSCISKYLTDNFQQ